MKKFYLLICLVFSLVAFHKTFAGCQVNPEFKSFNTDKFKGPKATPKDPVVGLKYYTASEAKKLVGKDDYVFVDTRPRTLFKQCHIKKSVCMPFKFDKASDNTLTKKFVEDLVKKGKTVIFYCNALKCYRSVNAAMQAVCKWNLPAKQIGWFGMGVPEMAKTSKRKVEGTNCEQFY